MCHKKKRKSNLAKTGERNTHHQVAEFFHNVASELVQGQITTNGEQIYGDVVNFGAGIGVEVKSSDNRHPWRVMLDQLDRHIAHIDDFTSPIVDFVYMFGSYKNNAWFPSGDPRRPRGYSKKTKTYSMLGRLRSKVGRLAFLETHVDEVWILDASIISAMRQIRDIRTGDFFDKPEEHFLRLRRQDLRSFRSDARSMLRTIKLDPRRFVASQRSIAVTFTIDGSVYTPSFSLYTLLRRRSARTIEHLFPVGEALNVA